MTIASQQVAWQRAFNEVSVVCCVRPFQAAGFVKIPHLEIDPRRKITKPDVGVPNPPYNKIVGGPREVILKLVVPEFECRAFDLQAGLTDAHLIGKTRRGHRGQRFGAQKCRRGKAAAPTVHVYAAADPEAEILVQGLDLES